MANIIYDITPFTLLDYPQKTACIIWFTGCNMRCAYCYNPNIVLGKGKISWHQVISFLHTRKGLLDAVVFSGGECTIHKHFEQYVAEVKALGFLVKIDTNGTAPTVLNNLMQQQLIDYVALDFKAPNALYTSVTAINGFNNFEASLQILLNSQIAFEVRTTYHSSLLNEENIQQMYSYLKSKNYHFTYYIQQALNNTTTLKPLPSNVFINKNKFKNSHIVFRN